MQAPSSVTWRSALLLTDRINMNALLYAAAPATLTLQWSLGLAAVANQELAWAGASIILAANLAAGVLIRRAKAEARNGMEPPSGRGMTAQETPP